MNCRDYLQTIEKDDFKEAIRTQFFGDQHLECSSHLADFQILCFRLQPTSYVIQNPIQHLLLNSVLERDSFIIQRYKQALYRTTILQ